MRGLIRKLMSVAPMVLVRVVGAVVTFGLTLYVARQHGLLASGTLFFFLSTVAVLGLFTRLGTEQYLIARVTPMKRAGNLGSANVLFGTFAVVMGMLVAVGVLISVAELVDRDTVHRFTVGLSGVWMLVAAVGGFNVLWVVSGYCRAMGRPTVSVTLESAAMSAWLFLLFLVWRGGRVLPSLDVVALALMALGVLVAAGTFAALRHQVSLGSIADEARDAAAGIFGFASVTVTNSIIVWLPVQALGLMGRVDDVGVYNAGYRVAMLVGAFGVLVKSVVVRAHVDGSLEHAPVGHRSKDLVRSLMLTLPFVGMSFTIVAAAPLLVRSFGADFGAVRDVLPVMLLSQCINIAGFFIETRVVLAGCKRLLNVNALLTVLTAVVATPLLIDRWGLAGAAWSFALAIGVARVHLFAMYLTGRDRGSLRRGSVQPSEPFLDGARH